MNFILFFCLQLQNEILTDCAIYKNQKNVHLIRDNYEKY